MSKVGMSKEMYTAIRWALKNEKLLAYTETGIVTNTRSNGTGFITSRGYLQISFTKNGKSYQPFIHQVIMVKAGFNLIGLTVNHISGDKLDNRLCNLEAVSNQENLVHALRTGLRVMPKGSKHCKARLTEDQVREIKLLLKLDDKLNQTKLAKKLGVHPSIISDIKRGKIWTHVKITEEHLAKADCSFLMQKYNYQEENVS